MGIEPTAAVPSQLDHPGISRSDQAAGSKNKNGFVASFKATVRTNTVDGVGKSEKRRKEINSRGSQDKPAQFKEEMAARKEREREEREREREREGEREREREREVKLFGKEVNLDFHLERERAREWLGWLSAAAVGLIPTLALSHSQKVKT